MIRTSRVIYLLVPTVLACSQTVPQQEGQGMRARDIERTRVHDPKNTPGANQPAQVVVPRSYALVIGISKYPYLPEKQQLDYPQSDAAGIYTALINAEAGQFPALNVHQLLGPKATLANIRHELEEWLPSVSKDDDRVLIYFAGHGIALEDGKTYLAPYDVRKNNIPGTAYSMEHLGEVFGSRIKAKWRVLLTDACHSGAILPTTDPKAINDGLKNVNRSIFSLTASREREQSYEDPSWGGGHGVFTYFVMKGLEGEADANNDGQVTADELAEYVHTNVRLATGSRQNPTSERGTWDPNMLLAFNPIHIHVDPPKVNYGNLVIEANKDGVEVFLDDVSQGIVNKGKPLQLPGIAPGSHKIEGRLMPYEPYGPEEVLVSPGQPTTVSVRMTIIRRHLQGAVDLFEKGLKHYTTGNESNYQKAAKLFELALQLDPKYSRAALYLGSAYSALGDMPKAEQYFKLAIELDPDYLDALDRYVGTLLDEGKFDTAVRILNRVTQRSPNNGMARYMLCVALTRLGVTDGQNTALQQALEEGRQSVQLLPGKGEPHFWLAEALRMSGRYKEAEPEYNEYVKLTALDSTTARRITTIMFGGTTSRASQHDIWMKQRGSAYFGLCYCEYRQRYLGSAIQYCQRSLAYDPQNLSAHFFLGESFVAKFNAAPDAGSLIAARKHFNVVIACNPGTEAADKAKKNIEKIDAVLPKLQ